MPFWAGPVFAQIAGPYDASWYTVDGGCGTISGGPYTLHGIIGQPDAGRLEGGVYVLHGGFRGGFPASDCNQNGIPDEDDISGCKDDPDCGDCNLNGIPDQCDIAACPPGSTACDDCNLNHIPDGCDIDGGGSLDMNADGVPDECVEPIFCDGSANWSDDVWGLLDGGYPDNLAGVPGQHVTIDACDMFLDVTVEIQSLRLINGATLRVKQMDPDGDLMIVGPEGMEVLANLYIGNGRRIDVSGGPVTIGVGGVYRADPDGPGPTSPAGFVSGDLIAGNMTVLEGPQGSQATVILDGDMSIQSLGDLFMDGTFADDKGDCTPLEGLLTANSELVVDGDVVMVGGVDLEITSSVPVVVRGNVNNQSTVPNLVNWEQGGLIMREPIVFAGPATQFIEAGGVDVGPDAGGLVNNFAIGVLTIESGVDVDIVDTFDNQQDGQAECDEALYIGTLIVEMNATLDMPPGCTVYYESLDNKGTIMGLGVSVLPINDCPADLSGNGSVGAEDLAIVLGSWGMCGDCGNCAADLDGNCAVGASDLAMLLGAWGQCG